MTRIILLAAGLLFFAHVPGGYTSPLSLTIKSDYYSYKDPDMAAYNQNIYNQNQAFQSLNTDDDIAFALTDLSLDYNKKYLNSEIFIKMRYRGFWGNDNLGENSQNSAIFYDNLYVDFYFTENSYIGIGRMNYSIGDALTDYFFDDIIDGAIIKYKSTAYGYPFDISVMSDITGMASRPDEAENFYMIKKDDEEIEDFQGDTVSTRYGANASFWFFKSFIYYVRYAASKKGGADIAQNGDTSTNLVDGDYLVLGGTRLFYDFKKWGMADLTYAYSTGYDFQYSANHKYNGSGVSINYSGDIIQMSGYSENFVKNIKASLSLGLFTDGYCGMKGASFGDSLLDEYYGYSVAPYAGAYHFHDYGKISDAPTYTDKTVSKTFYKLMVSTIFRMGIEFDVGLLLITANENGETGIIMGNEYITGIRYSFNNVVFGGTFSTFQPGDYYKSRSAANPYIPSGKDPFYSYKFSFTSKFTIIE
jgi:hypothetical protein